MMIHDITKLAGKNKKRDRVGRGLGSGNGKTAGRGYKGAGSRAGNSSRRGFEGGQMPYFRRLPKFGFTNVKFKTQFWVINLDTIVDHDTFANGGDVTIDSLIAAGLLRDNSKALKVLGNMPEDGLKVKLNVTAERVSESARKAIEAAGGSVKELGTRRDRVRGIDRQAGDQTPKNLTKKLKKYNKYHTPA
ncbi:MAG: 50S ribosomal protein L15 [Phycisphaeraceae bacterium]|nr:50S ribosomal protein L15 [Phycisphaerales bacterium]MCB9860292.1 50S ribosomal protein L15 [Phycisphaeraceae bacterium]